MPDIIISLRYNRETGKKDIVIWYESDDDVLRQEHEAEHAAIVEKLLGQIPEGERGDIIRERLVQHPPEVGQHPADPEREGPQTLGG